MMFGIKVLVLWLGVLILVLHGCAGVDIPDPHADVQAKPWSTEAAPNVSIVPVPAEKRTPRGDVVTNPSQTMTAFIVEENYRLDEQWECIYIHDLRSQIFYVILGVPEKHRLFSDLVWVTNRYLVFDRWSNPHFGVHYVVDAFKKKLVLAAPFPDQFLLDQQKPDRLKNFTTNP